MRQGNREKYLSQAQSKPLTRDVRYRRQSILDYSKGKQGLKIESDGLESAKTGITGFTSKLQRQAIQGNRLKTSTSHKRVVGLAGAKGHNS